MKLEAKLTFTHGILIVAMLVTSTVAYLSMSQVNRITSKFVSERVPVVRQAERVRIDLQKSSRALEQIMLFGADPAARAYFLKRHHDQWAFAETAMAILRDLGDRYELGDDNARIQAIDKQMAVLNDLETQIEELINSKKPEDTEKAQGLLHVQMGYQDKVVWDIIEDLINSENNAMEIESHEVHKATSSMMWTLWIATFLSSIIGGLLSMIISRRISHGVRALVERATAIAQGDLTGNNLTIKSHDEVGMLAQAMSTMQLSLCSIIGTVVNTAGTLTASAVSMGASSEQITYRMDQQSQQTQQAAAALQEMSACIAEVSRHSQSAADTARSASKTAHEGGTIVQEVLASMHSIADAVSETSSTISLLGEDSMHISQIVSVIEEIARKTNLLALNAAIEAARAGEQGRGFAVVAGEVRRLAESTAQATGEIAQMIQGIQERTRIAVAGMQSGTQTVQQGAVTTLRAGEALTRIIDMAERVDRMIAQIAIATSQQAAAADESSASVGQMHALSNENLSEMRTSAAGIASLRETALMLEEQVDRFRIESEDADATQLFSNDNYNRIAPAPAFV